MEKVDTIIAPATPPGEGGVAVLRISGPRAEFFLRQHFSCRAFHGLIESHKLYFGRIVDGDGCLVDEGMAVLMRAPRSFTREDVAEIHCHGGPILVRKVLDLFLDSGVRMAQPGEFTLRAFLNGRLDLTQAEAVIDLIQARSEASCRIAQNQLQGKLSTHIHKYRERLLEILSRLELHIDFSEDIGDLPDLMSLRGAVVSLESEIGRLIATFDQGRLLHDGVRIVILGKPNVGKSSLLNALLGEPRAIVTEVAGTTRDTIEENLVLGGVPVRIIDTAGVRDTDDVLESIGIERAKDKARSADLLLLLLDGSTPATAEDFLAHDTCRTVFQKGAPVVVVVNKSDRGEADIPEEFLQFPHCRISAKTGFGLNALEKSIHGMLFQEGRLAGEGVLVYERRHREALGRALGYLDAFLCGIESGLQIEFLAFEIRQSLDSLGEITGETTPDDVLREIFNRFCIGK